MQNLALSPTETTPNVRFNYQTGTLEISGYSVPEDSFLYYKPILDWLNAYSKNPAEFTEVVFKMDYFNTSSTVFLLKFIKGIGKLKELGKKISVKWYHKKDDEDMFEAGRDFGILGQINIELISY